MTNCIGTLRPNYSSEVSGVFSNLSSFTPIQAYNHLDEFSREVTLYLSDNVGIGMGFAILTVSLAIKFVLIPFQLAMVEVIYSSKYNRPSCE